VSITGLGVLQNPVRRIVGGKVIEDDIVGAGIANRDFIPPADRA
jgi:hypothetical protein